MERTILVTGGAGFIGSALVRHLVEETDHRVVNVDALTYAASRGSVASVSGSDRYAFEEVDVRDGAPLRRVFGEHRPVAVFHLAAETHVDRSIDAPADFLTTNVEGTCTLLDVALDHWRALPGEERRAFRYVQVSTDEVYGDVPEPEACPEDASYRPNSPYAASKAAADHFVRAWRRTYELPVMVTRCTNNYGPYQFPEKLIPQMILRGLEGRSLPVYGDGRQVRDWLHVDDHVRALLTVLEQGRIGASYNIGSGEGRENLEVVRTVCDVLDELRPRSDGLSHRESITFVEDRPGHDRRYALDTTRIRRDLGWSPGVAFDDGLRATVRWYLEHERWWRPLRERRYGGERLGVGGSARG